MLSRVLLLYGLASSVLYCCLLPLWEGFDELYHYGYVQSLANSSTVPEIGKTRISMELWTSLDFTPASHWVQPYFERPSTSFQQYFRLSDEERRSRRQALDKIDRRLQREPSPRENYEVKQSPLTYLLLAPIERLLAGRSLTERVLELRLTLSIGTITLMWAGLRRLSLRLAVTEPAQGVAIFVLFSIQMVYATTCHIANDALLAPWVLFFLTATMDFCESPTACRAAAAGLLMAVGVLLKSSALLFAPLLFAPALIELAQRRRIRNALTVTAISCGVLAAIAGPWFARNLILYRNLTAAPETSGIGPAQLLGGLLRLPWRDTIPRALHSGLWTGNNSFATFSGATTNVALVLFAICVLLWLPRAHRSRNEILVAVSLALYCVGLVSITVAFFISSHEVVIAPMPWYMEILLAPVVLLAFLALSRHGRFGRWLAAMSVLFWAYMAAATWLAKLLPLYGGFEDPHVRPARLWFWYWHQSGERTSILSSLCPGPVWLIYFLLALVLGTMGVATLGLVSRLSAPRVHPRPSDPTIGKA